ncbi:hypothetical protein Cgig2_012960 [Carnegiea gigantea]|uniref:Uncharacterized protein n=1 Tax=Carnegiea gigantea TaxID=171969 RepID=A0A9Q1GHA8_9CARY|nr:hypothetical protein Cgig2_012960 [Carnegiea gigantea]
MEALKKAYAEIILNTSKEAATRVMAAERKAFCFHHDLVSLKEESLRMFLRLKESFNSKITEAEARSFNQQMKIEELEAQLSEAEGIIVDLRYELKQVQEKLDVMKHSQKPPLSGPVLRVEEPFPEHVLQNNVLNFSSLVMAPVSDAKSLSGCETKVASLHPTVQINKCFHTMNINSLCCKSHLGQFHFGNCDFASIIMENRETELYRNGCTQRVRAFDRNLSNINLPSPSENHQPVINVQSETPKEQVASSSQSPVTDGAHNTVRPTLFTKGMDNGHQDHLASITTVQNREKKRGKASDELNADCPKMLKTSGKASDNVSFSGAHLKTVNVPVTSGKEPFLVCSSETEKKNMKQIVNASQEQLLQNCSRGKQQATSPPRRSARKNSRYREAIAALRRSSRKNCIKSYQPLLPSQDRTNPGNVNLRSSENLMDVAEERSKDTEFCSPSLSDELDNAIEIKVNCGYVVTREQEPDCREEGNAAKSRNSLSEKLYPLSVDAVLVDAQLFDVPISEGFGNTQIETQTQGQAGNDRHLKFTFQRRRRKNALGKLDGNVVLDRSTVKNGVEKPTDVPELEKCILEDGQNAAGEGGMQVAHQRLPYQGTEELHVTS